MADAKQVVKPAEAVKQQPPAAPVPAPVVAPAAPSKPRWQFVKTGCIAEKLRFRDGSTFQFRLIKANDGSGFMSTSFVVTEDETLAKNLRALAQARISGVIEVKA